MTGRVVALAAFRVNDTEFLRLANVKRFNGFSDGSGYCGRITVRAGDFACHDRQFYFDDLPQFVEQLRASHRALAGHAELRERYGQEFVRFECDSRGHFHITGFFTDGGRSIHFTLEADQTFLSRFIADLENIVRELHA